MDSLTFNKQIFLNKIDTKKYLFTEFAFRMMMTDTEPGAGAGAGAGSACGVCEQQLPGGKTRCHYGGVSCYR